MERYIAILKQYSPFVNRVGAAIAKEFEYAQPPIFKRTLNCENFTKEEWMSAHFRSELEKELLDDGLAFFLQYRSAQTLGYIYPTNLDQAIIDAGMRFMPIAFITALRTYYFPKVDPMDILLWVAARTKHLSIPQDVLEELAGLESWQYMVINENVVYYPLIVGNNIVNGHITNLEEDLVHDFGDFIHLIVYHEALNFSKLLETFSFIIHRPGKPKEPIIGTGPHVFSEYGDKCPFLMPEKGLCVEREGDGGGMTHIMADNMSNVALLVKNTGYEFVAEGKPISDTKVWAMSIFYKQIRLAQWSTVLGKQYWFSIFQTTINVKLLLHNFTRFTRAYVLCVSGTYWNGVQWAQPSDIFHVNSFNVHANMKIVQSATKNDIKRKSNQAQTHLSNIFKTGIAFYPFFNRTEISSPGHTSPTRSPNVVTKSIVDESYNDSYARTQVDQVRFLALFYAVLDNSSFISMALFDDIGDGECEVPLHMVIELLNRVDSFFIDRLFRQYLIDCRFFCMDLLNLAMQVNGKVLEPDVFAKLFFDESLEVAESIGSTNNFSYALDGENSAAEADGLDEQNNDTFVESIKRTSFKLMGPILQAPRVTGTHVTYSEKESEYLRRWNQTRINQQTDCKISRLSCFQNLARFSSMPRRDFDFNTVPDGERRKVVVIVTMLIRTRQKCVPNEHLCDGTSISALFENAHVMLEQARVHFTRVTFTFENNEQKLSSMIEFERALHATAPHFEWWSWNIQNNSTWYSTLYTLNFLYHFCDFSIENLDSLCSFIKSIDFPGNFSKRFLYLVGASNSAKSLLCEVLGRVYNCAVPNVLSAVAISSPAVTEMNNEVLPVAYNHMVIVDEIKTVNAVRLNSLVSPTSLGSRKMHSQDYMVLYTNAKLIIASNDIIEIDTNVGFHTRIFGIIMRHTFRDYNRMVSVWDGNAHNPSASSNWAIQRVMKVFRKGIDSDTLADGMFSIIRHMMARYIDPKDIVKFKLSSKFEADCREILEKTDPFIAYSNFEEKHYEELQLLEIHDRIERADSVGRFNWSKLQKKNIAVRLESQKREACKMRTVAL